MSNEDQIWQKWLAASASTFEVETEPPFGFTTRMLAQIREQQQEEATQVRLGFRAILFSCFAVIVAAAVTFGFSTGDGDDLDPGVKSLAMVENVQVS